MLEHIAGKTSFKFSFESIITVSFNILHVSRINSLFSDFSNIDLDFFIEQASSQIDANLSIQYDVPLKQMNLGGDLSYPHPIPVICAILAAQMYYSQALQGADRQFSEAQKDRFEWAMNELVRIQNGEIRLFGQRNRLKM